MVDFLEIKVPSNIKIAVIGDIHEHDKQFFKMIDKIKPNKNMWVVSVGDIYNKGFGKKVAEKITDIFIEYQRQQIGYVVRGNHELRLIRTAKKEKQELSNQLKWLENQPLTVSFLFENGTRITVLHAGVTQKHTWKDLKSNIEVCYIRNLNKKGEYIELKTIDDGYGGKTMKPTESGIPWHISYDGRFGYIVSGHSAQHDGIPKFYNYSCNLDTACYSTGILTAQIFSSSGLEDMLTVKGEAATPGKRYWTP